jgi:hypothetical protein
LRSETVANCSGDDVVELLSKPAKYVGGAAQVTAPSAPDRPQELRWFVSRPITHFMTIPVRPALTTFLFDALRSSGTARAHSTVRWDGCSTEKIG